MSTAHDGPAVAGSVQHSGLPSFSCDTMLGRLARWLRLLGYDTTYNGEKDDWDLVRQAAHEGRVLLTRDRGIMRRWQIQRGWLTAYLVREDRIEAQLKEVRARFSLDQISRARCPEDNHELTALPREDAREHVPPYVFETQQRFHTCPACGRIYWKATHWERIEQRLGS